MFPSIGRPVRRAILLAALTTTLASCAALTQTPAPPTPADFQGIAGLFVQSGLRIDHIVSGDAGCDDLELGRTAIAVDVVGLDQSTPTRVYLYIFRNRASFEKLRQTVDACAASYVTDPSTFESLETSPFVVTGQGPWAPNFRSAIRSAITKAAGTGD